MDIRFSDKQLNSIRDQALIYQCACPAQVATSISELRRLHIMQGACLNEGAVDVAVHEQIRRSAEKAHAEMESCLADILRLEGWDMQSLIMPTDLQKRLMDSV